MRNLLFYFLILFASACGSTKQKRNDIISRNLEGSWISTNDRSHTLKISHFGDFEYRNTNDFNDVIGFLDLLNAKAIQSGSSCKGTVNEVGADFLKVNCPMTAIFKIQKMPYQENENTFVIFQNETYKREKINFYIEP